MHKPLGAVARRPFAHHMLGAVVGSAIGLAVAFPASAQDTIKVGIYTLRFLEEPTEEVFEPEVKEEYTPRVEENKEPSIAIEEADEVLVFMIVMFRMVLLLTTVTVFPVPVPSIIVRAVSKPSTITPPLSVIFS